MMLENENPCSKRVGRIVWKHRANLPQDDRSVIVSLVHEVDRASRLSFSCGKNRFVNVVAVHPLAAEFGKQARMDVEDAIRKSIQHVFGQNSEKAG